MRISVLAVGTKMPAWVNAGVKEYTRRMPRQIQFSIDEIQPGQRSGRGQVAAAREQIRAAGACCVFKGTEFRAVLDQTVVAWNKGDLVAFMEGYHRSPDIRFVANNSVTNGWKNTLKRYQESNKEVTLDICEFSSI